MTLPRLIRAEEVAEATGLTKARVYKLAMTGDMPAVRVGRSVRFSERAILEWIEHGGTWNGEGTDR